MGQDIAFSGAIVTQGADRLKLAIEGEAGGLKFGFAQVLNGAKGWIKIDDTTMDMDDDDLAQARQEAYAGWVATLAPLRDKNFTLATTGEVTIDRRPALGVTVSLKDRRDVVLYFDKESNLLVKTETRVMDDNGQEVTEETFLSDYKEIQGTRQAMKVTMKRDGNLYLEAEVTDCQLAERLDDSVCARP
jgi:hypothetical protein